MAFIELDDVSFAYDGENGSEVPVINNIDLKIEKGSFVAIIGHNGSGKSTLAKLINLILTPDSGKIIIDGVDVTKEDFSSEGIYDIRKKVGMVFQNPDNQLVATVVEEDVAFGPENLGVESGEIRKTVDRALEIVGMKEYARHSPHQLSGGQKQRIAIAGVIAMKPECIIFDESTAMLDPMGRMDVMNTIKMLNKDEGITILHITHNMDEAVMADRVIVIDDGKICLDGDPKTVFSQVDKLNEVGLDVPQVTELTYELIKAGIPLRPDLLNKEEFADAIERYLK